MTELTQTTVASVLSSALRPVRSQLELAASQTSGIPFSSVQSALSLTDQVEMMVIGQYNTETDEFNALFDQLQAAEEQLTMQGLQVIALKDQLADQDVEVAECRAVAETSKAQLAILRADKKILKEENDRLQSMNPARQKSQISSLKETIAEKSKLLDQQKGEIRKARTETADTQTKLAVMVQQNTDLAEEVEEMRRRLQRVDGDVEPIWYPACDDSGLQFYFYTFSWRLSLGSSDRDLHLDILNDIDWHIEIRTNSGLAVLVSVTQWCRARYPILEQFKNAWPVALGAALNQRIIELLAETHPHLIQRAEWAQSVQLSSLPLKDQWLDLLNAADIFTLYTVVSHTPEELSNLVKGFGMATARQVHATCMNTVKDWQAKNSKDGITA